GTVAGLNRYDGYHFKVFRHDQRDSTSISDDYIDNIFEGPGNKLWISTRNGIDIYDPLTDRFDRKKANEFLQSIGIPNGNIIGSISDIKKDALGRFWFLTAGGTGFSATGMYLYDPASRRYARYCHLPADPASPCSNNIACFTLTSNGYWWLVYRDGTLERMDSATGRILWRTNALKQMVGEPSLGYRVFTDRQNDLWIYAPASSQGVYYYNTASGSLRHIDKGLGPFNLNSGIVTGITQDEKGLIWIATDHGGIDLLDKRDLSLHYIMAREEDDKSISQNSINYLYRDREGIIWIGTYKKGFNYYHQDIMKFPLYRHEIPGAKNLNYDDVNRFVEDPKGNLWIGSNGGGLIYYNRRTGHFTQYLHNPADPHSLTNDVIVSLCLDKSQKLWIGTYFGGLDCFDGKTFRHYRHNEKDSASIADDRVWEIMEDSKGRLWVGTFAEGLELLDRRRNVFHHYKPFAPNSVQSGYITGLTEDHKGNIWIATAYGLDELVDSSGQFVHYKHDDNRPETSLSNNNTYSAREDSRGLIWITTREGLDVFDPRTGGFRIFRKEDGLPDNTVMEVLEDNSHNLWLSTPNGLSNVIVSMDPDSRRITCQFRNYDESDGLQGREFNENAALRTSEGELIFGGSNGFNIFDPRLVRMSVRSQPLILTDFQVFNKSVDVDQKLNGHVILPQSISETKTITLRYNENIFSVEFAEVNFFNPERVKYAYMLEGFKRQWLLANDKTRKATFTNLDPGDYVFKVRSSNDKGGWNTNELTLNITILPPFWKTSWAYAAYVVLLIAFLFLARRAILQRARTRFAIEQERKEAQRLHELDMMKIRFFTNVSHEFRTPLSLILSPLDKIIRDTDNPHRKTQFRLIHRNARRLLNMVNQLLDFRKLEEHELRLSPGKGDIVKFIKGLSFSFVDMAEKKNIDFSFHTTIDTLYTSFDQDKVERIVFNLLSNAFKFTPMHGRISVELNLLSVTDPHEHGLLQLVIKDTGIGMAKEEQQRIFDRFFQNDMPGSIVNQGSGIGLAITREFVKLHKGSIHVESEPGKGSSFIVLLPVEKLDQETTALPSIDEYLPLEESASSMTGSDLPELSDTGKLSWTDGAGSDNLQGTDRIPDLDRHHGLGQSSGLEHSLDLDQSRGVDHGWHFPPGGRQKKPVVLLVEDNEDFRFYLKDNLREFFTIVEAANGREGWQKTLGFHPDLIVSDISMPEMTGIDLCRKIKSDKRTSFVPVILLTALIGEEQQLKGLETGANDYMTKPFNFGILLSKIRNLLFQQETARKTWQKQVEANPAMVKLDSPDELFMQKALILIEKNISNPDFSVEEMSRELYLSRVALYKRLLALTGKTPIEFIRSIRLKRAAQLLEMSRFTVAEIAYESGFNNPKYFSRYFKAEFGMLPSAYQLKRRKEIERSGPQH
ncbi:MAG: two-component regulator propeller domain-containing protein, partial [Bacteroidota bacterium]|nr:two-component regulator propeller domain-containing protein [Bacteroidota bacterium]